MEEIIRNKKNVSINRDITLLTVDNNEKNVAITGSPILTSNDEILGAVIIIADLTEKMAIEKELEKTVNLEMVGLLAGGIAHDFNNLLTAITGNISLIEYMIEKDSPINEKIARASAAAYRAKDLADQLLSFSKGGSPAKSVHNLKSTIKDTADFILSGSMVKCTYSFGDGLWDVEFNEGQISRVISNLIINAKQAMDSEGVIEIKVRNEMRKNTESEKNINSKFVAIEISDTGRGIKENDLNKIFTAYFTTKSGGHGIGLSMVYSIIRNHGGFIEVDSLEGVGSTFRVFLPAK